MVVTRIFTYVSIAIICMKGDQGFVENCQSAIFARTGEAAPEERLSAFVPLPQEFHAEKV